MRRRLLLGVRVAIGQSLTRCLEAVGNQTQLVSVVANGPIAARLADDLELLEHGALVPLQANLGNAAVLIVADNVSLREDKLTWLVFFFCPYSSMIPPITKAYNGNGNSAVSQEVVIKARRIRTTASNKLHHSLKLQHRGAATVNLLNDILGILLDLLADQAQVLDDVVGTADGSRSGDVVQGGIRRQKCRVGSRQELLVDR